MSASDRGAAAMVSGSRPYLVRLDASQALDDGLIFARCDCPRHEEGVWCKHVYATLLALDAQGIHLGTDSENIYLEFDDLDLDDFATDDLDEPRGGRPSPGWEESLSALERFLLARRLPAPADRERELLFQIDAEPSRRTGELSLSFFERKRKKNGQWGKARPVRIRSSDVSSTTDPSERELLEILFNLGARAALAHAYTMWGEREVKVGSATVPPSLERLLVPRLAATGRLLGASSLSKGRPRRASRGMTVLRIA